jgi:hypothetical protein
VPRKVLISSLVQTFLAGCVAGAGAAGEDAETDVAAGAAGCVEASLAALCPRTIAGEKIIEKSVATQRVPIPTHALLLILHMGIPSLSCISIKTPCSRKGYGSPAIGFALANSLCATIRASFAEPT